MSKAGLDSIPLARPSITDAERSAVLRVLDGTQLTGGPQLERFESLIGSRCNRSHALGTSSGTTALELALWALEIGPGDSVLVTAFGFPAAANAVAARGARPIAVDVEEDTWCMDFVAAREALDANTKAIVTIDQLGVVTPARDIRALEDETGLPVISDAACGFGGTDAEGCAAGSAGRVATLSFHPRKVITTGEGGALVCDDEELAQRLRELRNHGQVGGGRFARVGTNARLDECASAIGCAQMARLDVMLTERRMLVQGYEQRLSELRAADRLSWQVVPEGAQPTHQSFALLLAEGIDREAVLAGLRAREVACGVATYSFAEIAIHGSQLAPRARALHERAISLPLFVGMRSPELDRVVEALGEVLR